MTKDQAAQITETLKEIIEARFDLHLSPAGKGSFRESMEDSLERRYGYLQELLEGL